MYVSNTSNVSSLSWCVVFTEGLSPGFVLAVIGNLGVDFLCAPSTSEFHDYNTFYFLECDGIFHGNDIVRNNLESQKLFSRKIINISVNGHCFLDKRLNFFPSSSSKSAPNSGHVNCEFCSCIRVNLFKTILESM